MARKTKRQKVFAEKINRTAYLPLPEAIRLSKECATAKFDETLDMVVKLGVDPRHADQIVRGTCALPHGTGKTVRVLVFAKGEKANEARNAGADYVGAEDMVEKIQGGWMEFDRVVACPDMMGIVGKIGRVLGPRGLMPNPKMGNVTMDVDRVIKEIKAGQVAFRVEKAGLIHAGVGKASFPAEHLTANVKALIEQLQKQRPSEAKGTYMQKVWLSTSMGPGIKVDLLTV